MTLNNSTSTLTSTPRRVRVMIVDDQQLVRETLQAVLATEPSFEVVAVLASGEAALAQAQALQPDIVLMDIEMPGMDGLAATRALKQSQPSCEILMLTASDDREYLRQALLYGASGYILKRGEQANLIEAVKTVASGGSLINPAMLRTLIQEFAALPGPGLTPLPVQRGFSSAQQESKPAALADLTRREKQVLSLIGQGLSNATISQQLNISPDTVKSHVRAIFEKLDVRDRTQAAVLAVRYHLS